MLSVEEIRFSRSQGYYRWVGNCVRKEEDSDHDVCDRLAGAGVNVPITTKNQYRE